ncbi:MAG: ParB/RepB/Spo0J family partition protein [Candidatus Andersenbacteria bacterium]
MALGRGLASLIPRRNTKNAEDVLEHIDSMEAVEEDQDLRIEQPAQVKKKTVSVMEDFDELDDVDSIEMPKKPLVTPITFDPEDNVVTENRPRSVQIEEEVQDDVVTAEEDAPEEELESPVEEEEPVVPAEVEEEPQMPSVEEEPEEDDDEEMTATVEDDLFEIEEPQAKPVLPNLGEAGASAIWDRHEDQVVHVPIGDIRINPLQPRRTFDPKELEELRASIEQHGILQPIVVHRLSGSEGSGYELIAGERRLRAAKALNWDKVPAVVRTDVSSDQSRLVFALIENIQRQNLNPVEEAQAYMKLNQEYGLTHEEIGERVGKSRVGITNILRILQLPAEIQRGLTEGKITIGHAKAILMIPDEEKQIRFYHHLLDEGLTVRKAEIRARRIQRSMKLNDPMRQNRRNQHPLALRYSPALEERYGYNARVKFDEAKNRFEVNFRAFSEQEVEELVNRLLGTAALPEHDADIVEEDEA